MGRKRKNTVSVDELNSIFHRIYPDIPESIGLNEDQIHIIQSIAAGKDTINIMPTGSGKSACYLIAAMLLKGVTLVITPLVALMLDQVKKTAIFTDPETGIRTAGPMYKRLPVACISGNMLVDRDGEQQYGSGTVTEKAEERKEEHFGKRIREIRLFQEAEEGKYKIIYITPERLNAAAFIRFTRYVKISMVVVDEAHCISLWGYNFRKDYMQIAGFIKRFETRPVVAAFTATAMEDVREDIAACLKLRDPSEFITENSGKRDNLSLRVEKCSTLKNRKEKIAEQLRTFIADDPGRYALVFCRTVKEVNDLYDHLGEDERLKSEITRYYAELDEDQKSRDEGETKNRNLESFQNELSLDGAAQGQTRHVMIATNALGMGLDKRNIRLLIHFGMPLCVENYMQEIGRAGRDGEPAECVLYYHIHDRKKCEEVLEISGRGEVKKDPKQLPSDKKQLSDLQKKQRLDLMESFCEEFPKKRGSMKPQDLKEWIREKKEDQSIIKISQEDKKRFRKELMLETDRLFINTSKLMLELRKDGREKVTPCDITITRHPKKSGRENIKISYTLKISPENERGELDYIDLMIADAVYTLQVMGEKRVLARDVVALLSGQQREAYHIRPERKRMIEQRIEKMAGTAISIDISECESAQKGFLYRGQGVGKKAFEGPFLPVIKGKQGFAFSADRQLPPVYEFAEYMNGQFRVTKMEELRGRDGVSPEGDPAGKSSATWLTMALKHNLLTRIKAIKSTKKARGSFTSSVIKLERIKQDLGELVSEGFHADRGSSCADEEKRKRRREDKHENYLIEKIDQILQQFADENCGVIRDYIWTDERWAEDKAWHSEKRGADRIVIKKYEKNRMIRG